MIKTDNPAGRLHELLTKAQNQGNMPVYQMWATVLDVAHEDKTELFRRILHLHELVDEIKSKISTIKGVNVELLLSRLPNIENIIKISNFDTAWDNFKPSLSDGVMISLAFCAETLSRYGENPIDETELSSLQSLITDFIEELNVSSISPALKMIILDLLETIRRSIAEYKIRGAAGMRKELAYCIGMLIQNHELFKDEGATKEVGVFGKILGKFEGLINVALKLKELGFDFTKIAGMIGM